MDVALCKDSLDALWLRLQVFVNVPIACGLDLPKTLTMSFHLALGKLNYQRISCIMSKIVELK